MPASAENKRAAINRPLISLSPTERRDGHAVSGYWRCKRIAINPNDSRAEHDMPMIVQRRARCAVLQYFTQVKQSDAGA